MPEALQTARRETRLSEVEVRKRLATYMDTAVTDELYDFGTRMIEKALDRFKHLDTKAAAIAAYSIGIITLIVSTKSNWELGMGRLIIVPLFGVLAAFIAAACAVSALWLRKSYWFSQDEWLNAKHLSDIEALRRYHIINMWWVLTSHQSACDGKALRIAAARIVNYQRAIFYPDHINQGRFTSWVREVGARFSFRIRDYANLDWRKGLTPLGAGPRG